MSAVQARSALRAGAFFFVFVASVTVVKSATNALFLTRRDPTTLPYLYLATALAIALVIVRVGQRLTVVSAKSVLIATVWRSAAALLVLAGLAVANVSSAYGLLYVAGEVYATVLSVLFWARLGEVFDVRIAKRVFGFIGAAGMAGAVFGGVSVALLSSRVPSIAWCFVAAALVVLARPLLGRGAYRAIERHPIRFADGLRYAAKDGFPRAVALLVVLLAVLTASVDYVFRLGAARVYADDAAGLAGLFGLLQAVVGIGALAVQSLGTGPILRRFGVFVFLSVIPVLSVLSAGWALVGGGFVALFLLKAVEMMGSLSLHQPALAILYSPMPVGIRDAVRAVVDGAIKKLGGAVGGVVLLAVGALLPPRLALGLVIGVALLLLWRIYRLRRRYLGALVDKLARDPGRPSAVAIDLADRSTRQRLLTQLDARDPRIVLRALDILSGHRGPDLALYLVRLLSHPDETVRTRAIRLIERAPHPRYRASLERIVAARDDRPKGPAARALELVDAQAAARALTPCLQDPLDLTDPGLVCAAIRVGLQQDGTVACRATDVLQILLARGSEAPLDVRLALADLLGDLGSGPQAARLAPLLSDPDSRVRRQAGVSAQSAQHAFLPPRLVPLLNETETRRAAEDALVRYGDQTIPLLAEVLNDKAERGELRSAIAQVLRRMGTDAAATALLQATIDDEPPLRFVVIEALYRLRRNRGPRLMDPARVGRLVRRCLADYGEWAAAADDLAVGGPAFALVARAVKARQSQGLLSVVMLLGLNHDFDAIDRSVAGIRAGQIPDALELLDVALQGTDVRNVVLLGLEVRVKTAQPAAAAARARAFMRGDDRGLARIARRSLQRLGEPVPAPGEDIDMPDFIIDRLFMLEGVALFQGLSVDALTKVAAVMREGRAAPHQSIFLQGESSDSMYVIVAGEVRLLKDAVPLMELQPGDAFGQVALLDGGPRAVTAQAQEAGAEYLALERAPLMDLLAEEPALHQGLLLVMAQRLRELYALNRSGTGRQNRSRHRPGLRPPSVPLTIQSATKLDA